MEKKLIIQFWKTECALAMQIPEQTGLPLRPQSYDKTTFPWRYKEDGCFVKVNDDNQDDWLKCKLIGILPNSKKYRFIVENTNDDRGFSLYKEARPLVKEFPKVEENGPVVTYTWDEE